MLTYAKYAPLCAPATSLKIALVIQFLVNKYSPFSQRKWGIFILSVISVISDIGVIFYNTYNTYCTYHSYLLYLIVSNALLWRNTLYGKEFGHSHKAIALLLQSG